MTNELSRVSLVLLGFKNDFVLLHFFFFLGHGDLQERQNKARPELRA